MRKTVKQIIASFFVAIMLVTSGPILNVDFFHSDASAICCRKNGFDKSRYTLTGNMAQDVANIAKSQKGRTCNDFGYSGVDYGAWCDEFVADCIENAGADSSIVGHGGTIEDFERVMRSKGAVTVSSPKAGDLIFFPYSHVEIVTKVENGKVYCAGGNNNSYPGNCAGERALWEPARLYLRPNYKNSILDTQKPTITDLSINRLTESGYEISVAFSDNVGVTSVRFPTWTAYKDQDDIIWMTGKISGNRATVWVDIKDHNNEYGYYFTHVYVYDAAGNYASTGTYLYVPKPILRPSDGVYKIAWSGGDNKYLDFECSGNNVQIYNNCDNHSNPAFVKSQYFKITHVGDGWYTIVNTGNGKAVDVCDANPASGANIWQHEPNGSNAQLFRFYEAGDGCCYIKSKLGNYVDVTGAKNENKANVATYTPNGTSAQRWKLESHAHSYVSKVTANATCTSTGTKVNTCRCGVSNTETIAKKAHSYTSVDVSASKDQPAGKKYTCSECGYSYFAANEKKWSEWSTTYPTGVDSNLIESKKEYRYSDYQTTTSYNSSVSGYTYLNSSWEKEGDYMRKFVPSWPSGYPTNSNFYQTYNKSRVNSSETSTKKIVANEPQLYAYIYYHWCRGTYTNGPINRTTKKAQTSEFCKYHAFISDVNPDTLTTASDGSRIIARESLCKDTYWYYPVAMYSQKYTKYKKLNTFYRWTDFSAWSTTAYTSSSTRKVETRTLYRYVTYDPNAYEEKALGTTSKITATQTASTVKLAWKAVPGATGYRVFRYDAKTKKYVTVKTLTGTSYTVSKLKSGTSYKFAVRAYSTVNGTVYWASGYKTITATTNPGTPTLKVTAGSKKAALSWTKQTGATGYVVYMATSKNGKYTKIATLKGNTKVSYTKTGLTKGKTYYFKVAAYKTVGGKNIYSSYSSVKYVKIK